MGRRASLAVAAVMEMPHAETVRSRLHTPANATLSALGGYPRHGAVFHRRSGMAALFSTGPHVGEKERSIRR